MAEDFINLQGDTPLLEYLSSLPVDEDLKKGIHSLALNADLDEYKADPTKTLYVEQKVNICDVYIGFIDLLIHSPQRTTIVDHKFISNKRYIPRDEDLLEDPQTAVYTYAASTFFDLPEITFEYHYYGTMSKWHEKRKLNLTRGQVEDIWDVVKTKSFDVLDNYKQSKFSATTTNYFSCSAYGGCEFLDYCFK